MPRRHFVAVHCTPEPREQKGEEEGREREEEEGGHRSTSEAVGAGAHTMIAYSSAAWLPELHGLEPPLHHHPISHDTNGEPPSLSPARR